ncbi:S8 family serine peptidase [Ahniella affigens]|uniref:S8 family serine peptidase n=1 Tax=Ahniella affigens TaxID=2021234 RepID=UPI0011B1EF29|nr:S8 family serine peptidase [Ahniella affigens]
MKTAVRLLCTIAALGLPFAAAAAAIQPTPGAPVATDSIDELPLADEHGRVAVFVELASPPSAVVYAATLGGESTPNRIVAAGAASKTHAQRLKSEQASFASRLQALNLTHTEIFRTHRAVNGFAIRIRPDQVDAIRKLAGVKRVDVMVPHELHNQTSVPFIGAPNTWTATPTFASGAKGEGISIGIIDTGIDYQHPNVGGTGVLADYQANDRAVISETGAAAFPTVRVVGGTDFAGDLYTGANAPSPDPDPMDCNGHGSHVAGSSAGGGVNADGSPYTGPYNNTANLGALRIGPGVAPRANLYALRVFGCGGSTNLTPQAIDWATDPNNDDDLSDHLDVINMSLGSNYGSAFDASTIASDNAAAIGVIVVASAGNAADTYFISGSPGASQRTLAVANSVDSQFAGAKIQVNAPAPIAGSYQAGANAMTDTNGATPIPQAGGQTGNVVLAVDATAPVNDGCQALTNAAALAGNVALIDRGTCNFNVKIEAAQNAGALAVLIADNSGDPTTPALGGAATIDLTIPAIRITLALGNAIKAQLGSGNVNVTLLAANAGDTLNVSSSRGPRGGGGAQILKPDIAAPGTSITSMQTGVTCTGTAPSTGCLVANASGFLAAGQTLILSGTSMAAPHMAGAAALVRQQFPTRSVEEVKATLMNAANRKVTIGADLTGETFSTARIGSGRTEVHGASLNTIEAFNADEPGVVSLAFNIEPTTSNFSASKSVRLVNRGTTDRNLTLEVLSVVDAPGVSFSLPQSSLTLAGSSTATVDVIVNANATQMDRSFDPTLSRTQSGQSGGFSTSYVNVSRHFLSEESAILVIKEGAVEVARVPMLSAARPHSTLSMPSSIFTAGNPNSNGALPLSGQDVCTGTPGVGTCSGSFLVDQVSLMTPVELQVVSPRDPTIPDFNDLKYAGVHFDATANVFIFGVSTWGEWKTPGNAAVNICVDTDENGAYDRVLMLGDIGQQNRLLLSTATGQDVFAVSRIVAPSSISVGGTAPFLNMVSAAGADTAIYNSNIMYAAASPTELGLVNPDLAFRWAVATCPGFLPWCARDLAVCGPGASFTFDRAPGPFTYNGAAKGFDFTLAGASSNLFALNNATYSVGWNTTNLNTNNSIGALYLLNHNVDGTRDQVVLLDTAASSQLSVAATASAPSIAQGGVLTITYTVENQGSTAASGVSVVVEADAGLVYQSDDGVGAFNSANGVWTVGSLSGNSNATLTVTYRVDGAGAQSAKILLSAATPIDNTGANNRAVATVNATRVADVAVQLSASATAVNPGDNVVFALTLTNTGPSDALTVNVAETFAESGLASLAPASFTATDGQYNPSTGLWTLPQRAVNADASILQLTFVAPSDVPTMTLQATATSTTADSDSADNNDSEVVVVLIDPLFSNGFEN